VNNSIQASCHQLQDLIDPARLNDAIGAEQLRMWLEIFVCRYEDDGNEPNGLIGNECRHEFPAAHVGQLGTPLSSDATGAAHACS
jgi:hypothetical protein